jgi:ABC-type branched-subunit amino acid transport system ATPase component
MTGPILKVENVHAAYSKKEILRGLSFEVYPGEVVTLLGENGAGKSTALKVIAGLLPPTQGRVEFMGRDITHCDVQERQRLGIGCLLQGGRVFPNLTVEENFNLALSYARSTSKTAPQLGDVFSTLRERRNHRAGLLSGGQRQLLALEMISAQEPHLTLFDEPTSALSADQAIIWADHLSGQAPDVRQSHSVILVEHNDLHPNTANFRQLTLRNGELIESNNNKTLNV